MVMMMVIDTRVADIMTMMMMIMTTEEGVENMICMGIVVADMVEITDEGEASMTTGTREEDIISDDD